MTQDAVFEAEAGPIEGMDDKDCERATRTLAQSEAPSLNGEKASPLCWQIPEPGQHLESLEEKIRHCLRSL